jgi:methylenetetrahydrofolate reductase (NADPH)
MPHFTCVCSSREYVKSYLKDIEALEIENILALRGDEPLNSDICYRDFMYANELVGYIKGNTGLSIAVAGYPEGHPKSVDLLSDIENLKKKVDAGADVVYTQLFFDNDYFFRYKQLVRDVGIDVPIIPGILPILNYLIISNLKLQLILMILLQIIIHIVQPYMARGN